MAETLRLSKEEQRLIREKCIEINKILVAQGLAPLKDSEFTHKILIKSIRYSRVTKDGEIVIDA